jgi:hypothetical protein
VPLTAIEPRITAAIFGGGFFVYEALIEAARRITVPIQFLLPWDDEHVDRQSALALFDAFASKEKTLHANPGDHRTIRWTGVDNEFLARHLGKPGSFGNLPHALGRKRELARRDDPLGMKGVCGRRIGRPLLYGHASRCGCTVPVCTGANR